MASRERKRAARRKRKRRTTGRETVTEDTGSGNGTAPPRGFGERMARRSEERNREAREALVPLREDERPLVVTIGAVISTLFAASIVVAWLAGAEVSGDRPDAFGVVVPTVIIGGMAWGLWRARYWAVLGFQALLLIVLIAATLGLIGAESVLQAAGTLFLIAIAGTLFWFMIKAMARIQMPQRLPRD